VCAGCGTRRCTWAPVGHTPLLRYQYKHNRITAPAALTASPQRQYLGLHIRFQSRNFQALNGADFLRTLRRYVRGHLIMLWDRGSIR
jgi:hypothetical protein